MIDDPGMIASLVGYAANSPYVRDLAASAGTYAYDYAKDTVSSLFGAGSEPSDSRALVPYVPPKIAPTTSHTAMVPQSIL
jgi:hypothetical protein